MSLAEEIKQHIEGDVETSTNVRDTYSRDASIFRMVPQVVVFPKHTKDVEALVSFVAEQKQAGKNISLTARSGGTDMTGGSLTESILLVFTRYMNHVKEINETNAVVEPGMYYRDFDKETKTLNRILPSYPASREICAVGGMVANNAGGEKNLKYGKTERYVEGLTVVLRDGKTYAFRPLSLEELEEKKKQNDIEGEIYRKIHALIDAHYEKIKEAEPNVSKNSSGYYLWNVLDRERGMFDLTKLFVGSQGTLGIITDIRFRLIEPQKHSAMLIMFLQRMPRLGHIINHVLRHNPESFETYDDNTFKLAIKFFPEFAVRLKSNFIKLAWQFLPEFWMMLTGGIPQLVLLAEFTGQTEEQAHRQAQAAMRDIANEYPDINMKLARNKAEAEKYWVMRRESFNLLRKRIRGLRTVPFIDDFVVLPKYLPEFLPKLDAILEEYKNMTYTVAGHAGDGNFHIIPLMDPKDPTLQKTIREAAERVYDLVLEYNGSISGEHNDGMIRTPYVEKMYGPEIYHLFEETKRIFDPDNIFNPGKKVGTNLEETFSKLDISN